MVATKDLDRDAVILIVDDWTDNVSLLQAMLKRAGYTNLNATMNPLEAVPLFRKLSPDAVLLDLHMPRMDGFQVLELLSAEISPTDYLPVLILTADITPEARERALSLGAKDFISMPIETSEVLLRIKNVVQTGRLYREKSVLLQETLGGLVSILVQLLEVAHPSLLPRTRRVRALAGQLCRALETSDAWQVELAALLSHIGCLTLPAASIRDVLDGKDLPLEEAPLFANHPSVGAELVAKIPRLKPVAEIIAAQREPFATAGEGDGEANSPGTLVPFGGRILKAALDHDALVATGLSPMTAVLRMQARKGMYDPRVMDALRGLADAA